MTKSSSGSSNPPIWSGKPWILPSAAGRTIVVAIVAIIVIWLELAFIEPITLFGLPLILLTAFVFFLIWLFSIFHLLLMRAANEYILRNDSLEIKSGILSTKSFMISPSGFADLQVDRSVTARMVGMGDIIIRSQSESNAVMIMVRDPMKAAEEIRKVMSRPIVRIEKDDSPEKKN